MEKIRVAVCVPLSEAVRANRSEYGEGAVSMPDECIAELSEAGKALLARAYHDDARSPCPPWGVLRIGGPGRALTVPEASPGAVVAAIEALAIETARAEAKEREENERQILRALEAPSLDWIDERFQAERSYYVTTDDETVPSSDRTGRHVGEPFVAKMPKGVYLTDGQRADPRIIEQRRLIGEVVLPSLLQRHAERYEAWLVHVEAHRRAEVERAERWHKLCRTYVLGNVPEYLRAAEEGCNVDDVATKHLGGLIDQALSEVGAIVTSHGDKPHGRPPQRAFDVFDAVNRLFLPSDALVTKTVTDIVRVDTCPESGCTAGWRTCVRVTLTWANGATSCTYVYADRQDPHCHVRDDEAAEETEEESA